MSDQVFSASVPFPMPLCHLSLSEESRLLLLSWFQICFWTFLHVGSRKEDKELRSALLWEPISYSICARERTVIMGLLSKAEVGHSEPAHLPGSHCFGDILGNPPSALLLGSYLALSVTIALPRLVITHMETMGCRELFKVFKQTEQSGRQR